jgi:hypothetical protein
VNPLGIHIQDELTRHIVAHESPHLIPQFLLFLSQQDVLHCCTSFGGYSRPFRRPARRGGPAMT